MTADEACELPDDVQIALYRIAQEALNNVVKHAQASQVDVGLSCTSPPQAEGRPAGQGRHVELCVRDDGLGFDPGTVSQDHLGLGIMHERAESIHARLEIESEPGGGTQVTVVWTEQEEPITFAEGDQDE